jgi:hypothetical protein
MDSGQGLFVVRSVDLGNVGDNLNQFLVDEKMTLQFGCLCLCWLIMGNKFLSTGCCPPISLAFWKCAKPSR